MVGELYHKRESFEERVTNSEKVADESAALVRDLHKKLKLTRLTLLEKSIEEMSKTMEELQTAATKRPREEDEMPPSPEPQRKRARATPTALAKATPTSLPACPGVTKLSSFLDKWKKQGELAQE